VARHKMQISVIHAIILVKAEWQKGGNLIIFRCEVNKLLVDEIRFFQVKVKKCCFFGNLMHNQKHSFCNKLLLHYQVLLINSKTRAINVG